MSAAVVTFPPSPSAHAPTRHRVAYRCEATARNLSGHREVLLATYRAATPRLAARWLRAEAQRLARLLAPEPSAPCLRGAPLVPTAAHAPRPDYYLLVWAGDDNQYDHALRILCAGNAYVLAVTDYDARYSVRVYPLPVQRAPQTPAPAGCFPCAPAGAGRHPTRRRGRHAVR
ncbi:hypothetical protein [Streptomyces celluloflavus]|uniref:hypothetical protein n=1 Tax=Streptomyces celluloflavus TaxID=58344 RepID=UPI00364EF6CA